MRRIAILVLTCAIAMTASTAKAQLFLEEGKVVLAVEAGEHVNKSITVANTSAEEVHVKVYWEDFQYQPPYDGTKKFFPSGIVADSASHWISFMPQELALSAFGKQKIDYSISVPKAIEKGYYGVLFFERTGKTMKDASGLDIVLRVGSLFFIEPKSAVRTAELKDIAFKEKSIFAQFVNNSQVTLIPRAVYYIMEEGGMVKDRGELKNIYVPAHATASYQMPLPVDLNPGQYVLVINIDLGDEHVLTKELGVIKSADGQITIDSNRN